MRRTSWLAASVVMLASAAAADAAAADASGQQQQLVQQQQSAAVSRRPLVRASPKSPRLPIPSPAERTKGPCVVRSHGDGEADDSAYVLAALRECNDGGHVVFARDQTYVVGTAMDWTFLRHIDIGMLSPPPPLAPPLSTPPLPPPPHRSLASQPPHLS